VTLETVAFWALAAALVGASLAVVLTPNLFHAVLWLAAALVATGGVFLLLRAPFLFGVQLLLYAGGVVTIVVFAIMLTERLVGESLRQTSRHAINGAIVAAAVLVGVAGFLVQAPAAPPAAAPPASSDPTAALGAALVGPWAVVLELLGVLLVIALLGATYFARTED
jgi:NADH-quinone oxidoreductase subunit J